MKKKRPSKASSPSEGSPEFCKSLLAFTAEITRTPDELKETANEIIRVLAKDVLLSQIHQGRPIENADIGAIDRFYTAQQAAPHVYLTLIEVSGWASHDDDAIRNAQMVSGRHTEGSVKDGSVYVSLLSDTKVSRFYLAEASVPDDNETIPLLRGDPIPVIAGPCSAADLWCALEQHAHKSDRPLEKEQLASEREDDGGDEHERFAQALELKGEELERFLHSHRHPAFNSSFTFDISFEFLGTRVRRKARVIFESTPEGEYFDLAKNALFNGWGNSSYFIELQGWEEGKDGKRRKVWHRSDINDVFLTEKLSLKIFDLIDEECERLDRKRRNKANLSAPKKE